MATGAVLALSLIRGHNKTAFLILPFSFSKKHNFENIIIATDPSNGQLHKQYAGGNVITSADPLCDFQCVDIPPVPQGRVDQSLFVPETRIYPHPYIELPERSISGPGDIRPPGPRKSPQKVVFKVPAPVTTRSYHHPYVKVPDYSSSEDDDLPPPRPKGSQNKAISQVPYSDDEDLPPPPSKASQSKAVTKAPFLPWAQPASKVEKPIDEKAQKILNILHFNSLLAESGIIPAHRVQWLWAVPEEMYHPWMKYTEVQAEEIVSNAEANTMWKGNKTAFVFPGGGNLFTTYNGKLLDRWVHATVEAINKSMRASAADSSRLRHTDDNKVWEIGCNFAIFSLSDRVKLQNTAIVPYEVIGTCDQARNFFKSEETLRKLAHLDLLTVFELPDIMPGQELSKIAFAFFKGHEIPENVELLPVSPDACPKEYHIDYEGRSDRSKVVKSKPLQDPVLALFLQDVMISNHLEYIRVENLRTLSGQMPVRPGCGSSDITTKLKAREHWIGKRALIQSSAARHIRQQRRSATWWYRQANGPAPSLNLINCVPNLIKVIEAGPGSSYLSLNCSDRASGTNGRISNPKPTPEETVRTTKSKKSKSKGKTKNSNAVASTGIFLSSNEESSSILPPSASDSSQTRPTELGVSAEENTIVGPNLEESTTFTAAAVLDAVSSGALALSSQPTSPGPVPVAPEGMSKKNKKKQKEVLNDSASSSNPTPSESRSQGQSTVKVIVGELVEDPKTEDKSGKKPGPVAFTEDNIPSVSLEEPLAKSDDVHGINALGISMPMDSEVGTWETVKSRSTQKQKVTVQASFIAARGNMKGPARTSRYMSNQLNMHRASKIVISNSQSGQKSKIGSVVKPTATKPNEIRLFDPNEFPAMPTPANDKIKVSAKDTVYDTKRVVSQNSPASESAIANTQALSATLHNIPKVSGTTTPKLESSAAAIPDDPDLGDLYGASPPRRTRTAAVKEKVASTAPAKLIKDDTSPPKSTNAAQVDIKSAVPLYSIKDPKHRESLIAVPDIGMKVDKKQSSVVPWSTGKETSLTGSTDPTSSRALETPVFPEKSEPNAGEKTATKAASISNPKLDAQPLISCKIEAEGFISGILEAKIKIAIPTAEGLNLAIGKANAPINAQSGGVATAKNSTSNKYKRKAKEGKSSNNSMVAGPIPGSSRSLDKGKSNDSAALLMTVTAETSTKSDDEQACASTSVPTHTGGRKKNNRNKSFHKGRKDGSTSDSIYAGLSTTTLPAEIQKLPALDQNVNSSRDSSADERSTKVESIVTAVISPSHAMSQSVPTSTKIFVESSGGPKGFLPKPVVASEQIIPHMVLSASKSSAQKPEKKDFKKPEISSVPTDLAWADLCSPAKPGYLKQRRLSAGNTQPDEDDLEDTPPLPIRRRSSISAATPPVRLQFGQLTPLITSSSATGDDPFISGVTEFGDAEVSYLSSSTDGDVDLRDSRASPGTHATPRTDLMHTPLSPDDYNGEPYVNILGHEVTLFRRDAEMSGFQGQKHHQRASSVTAQGSRFVAPHHSSRASLEIDHAGDIRAPGHSSYDFQNPFNINSGQGAHSHPQPTVYGAPQVRTHGVQKDGQVGQASTSNQSLGGDLKSKGPEKGTQGGINQGLSPIPEAPLNSEAEAASVYDHNPPTKCSFCEDTKVPTADNPFHFCPLCGVDSSSPRYCSVACLLANAWEHTGSCLNTAAYNTNSNTNLGPTYSWIPFPMTNCHYMPDSPEKYRQKIFAMFCKFGEVPDIRYAHSRKWPDIDWSRIMPSCARTSVGDYHIFKSSAIESGRQQNPSKAHVICTINLPNRDGGVNMKLMITRALNVAFVTHDAQVIWFLSRILRYVLQPHYFQNFMATEPQLVVMAEFKSQFFKEFGVAINDNEPFMVNPAAEFATIHDSISRFEIGLGSLQYWLNVFYNRV
ncbi:uncharacterized protein RAG0_09316 [Rhynchosporium agropyri]|uniref:Uncharacterized protein n=1 Tax=Rhynchosporium agropyri TaxID=914238 RepID=A0A1E1KUX2_9HELO|nr:uncharacterized protein RAG0_09316 [Rhynchosporium agropyri]